MIEISEEEIGLNTGFTEKMENIGFDRDTMSYLALKRMPGELKLVSEALK
jgi:hypothetical protein